MAESMTPREIVAELDRYIVGQHDAKKAVAVAIRNRWRRQQLPADLRKDITPKNIILIGPTGVGKTEIARRLAQLVGAPFLKVVIPRNAMSDFGLYGVRHNGAFELRWLNWVLTLGNAANTSNGLPAAKRAAPAHVSPEWITASPRRVSSCNAAS